MGNLGNKECWARVLGLVDNVLTRLGLPQFEQGFGQIEMCYAIVRRHVQRPSVMLHRLRQQSSLVQRTSRLFSAKLLPGKMRSDASYSSIAAQF